MTSANFDQTLPPPRLWHWKDEGMASRSGRKPMNSKHTGDLRPVVVRECSNEFQAAEERVAQSIHTLACWTDFLPSNSCTTSLIVAALASQVWSIMLETLSTYRVAMPSSPLLWSHDALPVLHALLVPLPAACLLTRDATHMLPAASCASAHMEHLRLHIAEPSHVSSA